MSFKITSAVIDPAARKQELTRSTAGACVTFEGWVRDHNEGSAVQALEYEAHQAIAEKEGARIIAEALERFAVTAVHCEHRVGKLAIGDCAVWVGVSADHRGAAFDACRFHAQRRGPQRPRDERQCRRARQHEPHPAASQQQTSLARCHQ